MTARFAARMQHVKPSAIRDLLRFGADPSIISFGGGYPDATLFPLEQLDAVFSRAIIEHGRTRCSTPCRTAARTCALRSPAHGQRGRGVHR